MSVITGWRPYPWTCDKCGSGKLTIEQTHNVNDPQEIRVTCECGSEHYTSAEPIFIDMQAGTCREATDEEKQRVADKFKRFAESEKGKEQVTDNPYYKEAEDEPGATDSSA